MKYYFEKTKAKGFRGQQRTTVVTTINRDIKRTLSKVGDFEVMELKSLEILEETRRVAQDRIKWRNIVNCVGQVAEDEKPFNVI